MGSFSRLTLAEKAPPPFSYRAAAEAKAVMEAPPPLLPVVTPMVSAETLQQRVKQRKALIFVSRFLWFVRKVFAIMLSLVSLVVISLVADNKRAGRQPESRFDAERYRDGAR